MNNFESEISAYLKGYIDGIIDKRLSAIEERITALETKTDEGEEQTATIPKKTVRILQMDFKTAIRETADKSRNGYSNKQSVYSLLKSQNYSLDEIYEMEDKLCQTAEIIRTQHDFKLI